jgi:hypothetical protein
VREPGSIVSRYSVPYRTFGAATMAWKGACMDPRAGDELRRELYSVSEDEPEQAGGESVLEELEMPGAH